MNGRLGNAFKGRRNNIMYHWIDDKDFLKRMHGLCSNLINELVQYINSGDYLKVEAHLVGSGDRNLITQNADKPIDLDYNLNIIDIDGDINDAKQIKEYIREAFNFVLKRNNWGNCKDSTSALTTEKLYFTKGNDTEFSIDLAITYEDESGLWNRLIHDKTGIIVLDRWYRNQSPNSKQLKEKERKLKKANLWDDVREAYLKKKNMYLVRNNYDHPSFVCYIEAVNEIYNREFD